jgi:hypothetical protein
VKVMLKAAALFVVLAGAAWRLGVEKWFITALWAFIALWSVPTAIALYRSTHRREVLASGILSALGAACFATVYALSSRTTGTMAPTIAGAVLIACGLVMAIAGWRRISVPVDSRPLDVDDAR